MSREKKSLRSLAVDYVFWSIAWIVLSLVTAFIALYAVSVVLLFPEFSWEWIGLWVVTGACLLVLASTIKYAVRNIDAVTVLIKYGGRARRKKRDE